MGWLQITIFEQLKQEKKEKKALFNGKYPVLELFPSKGKFCYATGWQLPHQHNAYFNVSGWNW